MYGFVVLLVWGGVYGLLPRMTGREPSHLLAGIHFWFDAIGMGIYTLALMIGGTLQGLAWMGDSAFMESVRLMADFWLWRAVGGSLMFLSHLLFAWNLWHMRPVRESSSKVAAQQQVPA